MCGHRPMHKTKIATMKRPLPTLTTDAEAEAFVHEADLSAFDLSTMVPTRFEFAPKDTRAALDEIRVRARAHSAAPVPWETLKSERDAGRR